MEMVWSFDGNDIYTTQPMVLRAVRMDRFQAYARHRRVLGLQVFDL